MDEIPAMNGIDKRGKLGGRSVTAAAANFSFLPYDQALQDFEFEFVLVGFLGSVRFYMTQTSG